MRRAGRAYGGSSGAAAREECAIAAPLLPRECPIRPSGARSGGVTVTYSELCIPD